MAAKAAGGLGEVLIFSESKGRPYAKKWAKPANPQTGGQQATRAIVNYVSKNWRHWPDVDRLSWEALAAEDVVSPLNACIAFNVKRIRNLLYPCSLYPPEQSHIPMTWEGWSVDVVSRGIKHTMASVLPRDGRGWTVHRTSPTLSTRTWDNFVHVIPCLPHVNWFWWTDRLSPGTYHYRVRRLADDARTFNETTKGPFVVT